MITILWENICQVFLRLNLFNGCWRLRPILRNRLNYFLSRYVDFQRRNSPIKHRRPSYAATALCRHVQYSAKWGNPSAQSKRYRNRWIHVSTCVQKVFHIKKRKESKKTEGDWTILLSTYTLLVWSTLLFSDFHLCSFFYFWLKIVTLINPRRNNCQWHKL